MKKTTNSSPYQFEGRIPLSQAIPLGLQHVMAMFIGNLTPLIIVMGACGLTADAGFAELRTALLQNAMIIAGIVTLVQMFSIGPVGGKVPIVMGTSSGFLGVLNNTVAACKEAHSHLHPSKIWNLMSREQICNQRIFFYLLF